MNKLTRSILALACGITVHAGAVSAEPRDAYGRPVVPEALSAASAEQPAGVPPAMFDLGILFGAAGANDDSSGTEEAIAGASLWYYPPVSQTHLWLRLGGRAQWTTGDRAKVEFSLVPDFVPFSNEESSALWHFTLDVLPHYTIRTEKNEYSSSAWTWRPGMAVSIEKPMGDYAIQVGTSVNRLISEEGNTELKRTSFAAGAQFLIRLGR